VVESRDNGMACGASAIISEPYTDYRRIARRHPDCFVAGEGDNRVRSTIDNSGRLLMPPKHLPNLGCSRPSQYR
jgi:hypothetical protein